jgi:hypothetical protein
MKNSKIGKERLKQIINTAFQEEPVLKTVPASPNMQPTDWKDLQIKVKEIYESLGCDAKEDINVQGIRTKHQIDVFAVFNFGGQVYRTIIECKYWNSRVKKGQVGTLLGVIADIGAEKGVIVSKKGFQSGAREFARYTNISLVSYDELVRDSEHFINKFKLESAIKRLEKMENPFTKFYDLMTDEAEKSDAWWYPNLEGSLLLGVISILKHKIEHIETITYPAGFIFGSLYLRPGVKEVKKFAKNQSEYTDLILSNITTLELEFETLKGKIFGE